MMSPSPPGVALAIARHTALEAWRNRLLWLLLLAAAGAVALGAFLDQLALTESRQLQAAVLAALLRLAAVFLIAAFVVTSMLREAADKGLELLLALPVPRYVYLLGKLAGFAALAVLPAALFGALALLLAPAAQALLWSASLLCELWIVAAFSLLCAVSLRQALPALAAAGAFYLLARLIALLQLLGQGPGATRGPSQRLFNLLLDGIALLLPHLESFTRTEWLLYQTGSAAALVPIVAQTAIFVSLMAVAALFDLYRKNL